MEVKVFCPCGAKYKFEVEPVEGKLPGPVQCPVCAQDGTELGNAVIAKKLAAERSAAAPISNAPAAPVLAVSSNALGAIAQPRAITPPVASVAPTEKRLSVAAVHVVAPAVLPVEAAPAQASHPIAARGGVNPLKLEMEPSFARGVFAIAAASLVGLVFWFFFTLFLGLGFRWIGIGIGAMVGWTGAKFAKQKSQRLGITAAAATALIMVVGVLWSARQEAQLTLNEAMKAMWQAKLDYAKNAVQASRSDEQLRKFLVENGTSADQGAAFGDDQDDAAITRVKAAVTGTVDDKALADFKQKELPELRKIAEGQVSRFQFEREQRAALESVVTFAFIVGRAFRIKMVVMLGIAVAAAWKCASNQ